MGFPHGHLHLKYPFPRVTLPPVFGFAEQLLKHFVRMSPSGSTQLKLQHCDRTMTSTCVARSVLNYTGVSHQADTGPVGDR